MKRMAGLAYGLLICAAFAVAGEPAREAATVDVEARFAEFLGKPSKESFLAVQAVVMKHASYAPYSPELDAVADLLEEKKFSEAREQLDAAGVNLLLSPRAHQFRAQIELAAGKANAAEKAAQTAKALLEGIRATGDGTEQAPFKVTRTSDEFDIARSLNKRVSGQGRRSKDNTICEVLQLAGGGELWFDVTVPFGKMTKKTDKK